MINRGITKLAAWRYEIYLLVLQNFSTKGAIYYTTVVISRVKISCFRAKAQLVFHWCLYNKLISLLISKDHHNGVTEIILPQFSFRMHYQCICHAPGQNRKLLPPVPLQEVHFLRPGLCVYTIKQRLLYLDCHQFHTGSW